MDKPFNLMPSKPIETEAALIQVAAWLWEAEDWQEMQATGWERAVEDLASRGAGVWCWAAKPVELN